MNRLTGGPAYRSARQRETLPALMHEVQTLSRFGVRPTTARTVWMLGFQRRGVRRCEWEMLLPKPGPLPQTSQLAATGVTPRLQNHLRETTPPDQRSTHVNRTGPRGEPGPVPGNRKSIQRLLPFDETTMTSGVIAPAAVSAAAVRAPITCPYHPSPFTLRPSRRPTPEETWCCTRSTPRPCAAGADSRCEPSARPARRSTHSTSTPSRTATPAPICT